MRRVPQFVLLATVAALGACSSDGPTGPGNPEASVSPLCQLGCIETDPNPAFPGYFLGSGVTPEACDGDATDADSDGLSDFCEKNLIAAFSPELYYWFYDAVGREPYWAARWNGAGKIRLVYLLSYYEDLGSDSFGCTIPPFSQLCLPHHGDSEVIVLDVYYVSTKEHWVLNTAFLSQHGSYVPFDREVKTYPIQLMYPTKAGGYPRVYVAEKKHANYASMDACNSGGQFDTDTCEDVNTAARDSYGAIYNIGSDSHRLIDCVTSRNPSYQYYGEGRTECYWTSQDFRGWVPARIAGTAATAYSDILADLGF